ncbi:MFS transporter [Arthrobacter castelli]|uniref:MFS transporter n=1 Tax=Arthrobacter castelli TaxID=271431 RepID=UPI0003FB5F4A|nr:MFS transporter [Arthrobacter castelli]
MSSSSAVGGRQRMSAEDRKVVAGTMVGTTIEWYDFFIYAQAAGLIFASIYFKPLEEYGLAQLVSWASLGISFFFRPLGAVVGGHLGDRIGRKATLVLTLVMMGSATALIGLIPTYGQIGLAAPILLIVLRIIQGFSAGGEWGGAALMAVEHAPLKKRGFWGAYPQIGVPVGMILATLVILLLRGALTQEQFLAWGWRIPFLFSVVLIVIGYIIRSRVAESPVFKEMQERKKESSAPLGQLFRQHKRPLLLTALIFIANNAAGYLLIAYFSTYAQREVGMEPTSVLAATLVGAFSWLVFTMYGGVLSDRIGRVRCQQIGYGIIFVWMIPLFLMIDANNIWLYALALIVLAAGLGISYGPMSAMFAELFPVGVRYSGISIGYAMGAVFGGAFAPLIADALLGTTGWSGSIALYIMVLALISGIAAMVAGETKGNNLRVEEVHPHAGR